MAHPTQETEIKLAYPDVDTARKLLRSAGFRIFKRRVFEVNTVYDTPRLALRTASTLLRVRRAGPLATITYKGRPAVSRYKSREELEVEVSDPRIMGTILVRLGFHPAFRYEKYRTELRQPGLRGIATIDETPIGVYVELEGTPAWIDRAARRLGFAPRDYVNLSYAQLYLEWCRRRRIRPSDMVFGDGSKPA
jgi:adenylate cyclase class 2